MTCVSIPRARNQHASQKPSRPASKATAMPAVVRPPCVASSFQRCRKTSSASSFALSFLSGRRPMPGHHPSHEPSRLAQFHTSNEGAFLCERDRRSAQIVQLGHRATPLPVVISADCASPSPLADTVCRRHRLEQRWRGRHIWQFTRLRHTLIDHLSLAYEVGAGLEQQVDRGDP
jgi:hypothetical protein